MSWPFVLRTSMAIQLTERDDARERVAALGRERKDVEKRIGRLRTLVETGAGDVTSLVDRLRELETRRRAIDEEMGSARPVPRLAPEVVEDRLAEWRRLLRQSMTQGRAVLQRILVGRVTFTPRGDGYTFEAPTRFDKLFRGIAVEAPAFVERGTRGAAHIGLEDTFDGDYGRLLERATAALLVNGKGVTSPAGIDLKVPAIGGLMVA
jgi:hypothetical protein